MAEVRWASSSLQDLREILLFLSEDDPAAASRYAVKFEEAADKIQQWPRLGHQVEKYPQEVRALFIRPYRFVYRLLNSETIEIVRILHSKRLLPEDLEED